MRSPVLGWCISVCLWLRTTSSLKSSSATASAYGRRQGKKVRLVEDHGDPNEKDATYPALPGGHRRHLKKFGRPSYFTGEGERVAESCYPKRQVGTNYPPTVMVTTTSAPYMLGSRARNWESTLWGPDSAPHIRSHTPLWVYHENRYCNLFCRELRA